MAIRYFDAPDIEVLMRDIVNSLELRHIDLERVGCVRSKGSAAYRTVARCHGMPKILQMGMKSKPFYVIEVIEEQFDKMSKEEQVRTIIHELMHIPKSFGGGFRHHDFVNRRNIEKLFQVYAEKSNLVEKSLVKKWFFP